MRERYVDTPEKEADRYLALCDMWRKKYLGLDRRELQARFRLEGDEEAQ